MDDLDSFEELVRRRRSVRAFRSDPIDRSLIARAVAIAAATPSSCNTQPWRLHIASGAAIERLRIALLAAVGGGAPRQPEVEYAARYQGEMRARQIDAAVRLFAAQGVERHDHDARRASMLRNYAFFDAPYVAFLFMPHNGGLREAADCSKFAMAFMLALTAAGIGSCPQGALSDFPGVVREALALDEPGLLLLGISFGHADEADPTAQVRTPRRHASEIAAFHDC